MASAREEVLRRVRTALADRPRIAAVPRSYRLAGEVTPDVEQLVERITDYRATAHRCASEDASATATRILHDRGIDRIVAPDGFPDAWLPSMQLVREPVDTETLDDVSAVVTTCAVAIGETGTIVLDAGPGQGPRVLTLVPDYHLVLVSVDQVVAIVPDALARLDPTRPLTWISGPSATSDIELKRVEGVHGPRALDVLVVSGG